MEGTFRIYRAAEPLSSAELAVRRGITVKECKAAMGGNFLCEGEYCLLPIGRVSFRRLNEGDILCLQKNPTAYRRTVAQAGLPFLYLGCPVQVISDK